MFFTRLSIKKKVIISSLMVAVIPLLLLEILFSILNYRDSVETTLNTSAIHADNLQRRYAEEFYKLERLAGTLQAFQPLDTFLSTDFENNGTAFSYYYETVHPMLSNCSKAYDNTVVRVYHNEPIPNFSFYLNNEWADFEKRLFEGDSIKYPASGWVKSNLRYYMFKGTFCYYMAVRSKTYPYDRLYCVTVHVDEDFFYEPLTSEYQENCLVIVLDREGNILSASDRSYTGGSLDNLGVESESPIEGLADREIISINQKKYYLFRRQTSELSILYLAERDWVNSVHNRTMFLLIAVGVLLIVLAACLIVRLMKDTVSHIEELKQKMTNVSRERIHGFADASQETDSQDEIEQLDIMFGSMMREIDGLMERTQQQDRKLQDEVITRQRAEIHALQRQIDPHYLFNTLEAIRMNLLMKNDRQDAEIVKLFAESFRRYVDITDEFVPLFEEIAFIRKYIQIQNYRLNDRIQFSVDADEHLLHFKVMKLMLQPLVENAVVHGLEERASSGSIVVRVRRNAPFLEISIEDDGVGMDVTELADLRARIYSGDPGPSVGLQNTYQRIRIIYGDLAGMTVDSRKGEGTIVRVSLPLSQLEEEGNVSHFTG